MLWDKNAVMQVFGSLLKNTSFLSQTDKYTLSPDSFDGIFEKTIFSAISNLYFGGAVKVTIVDVDTYLSSHPAAYAIFTKDRGLEYLNDAVELSNPENFEYYYERIQKFNCLRGLKRVGLDVKRFYSEDPFDEKSEETNKLFDSLSVKDIILSLKKDIAAIEVDYDSKNSSKTQSIAEGIKDLVNKLKIEPEIGLPLQGEFFNSIVRGARKGKFYIRSGSSGAGKSRSLVGDACKLAYPVIYDTDEKRWVQQGIGSKVLYITTEQSVDEIQTMVLAYLSGINEEKILFGKYAYDEEKVVLQSCDVMEKYKENLIIVQIPNPDIEQIKALIRQNYILYDIDSVFYDYIFSSPSLLREFKDLKIREDVALMLLSTCLKDLAVELNLFVFSATQVNGELESKKGTKDQTVIQGSKAIVNKVDVGCVLMAATKEDHSILSQTLSITQMPNLKTDVYKIRRGKGKNARIWSHFDLGTCRKIDVFVTDSEYNLITDLTLLDPVYDLENNVYIDEMLATLNPGQKEEIMSIEHPSVKEEKKEKKENDAPWFTSEEEEQAAKVEKDLEVKNQIESGKKGFVLDI